MSAPRKYLDGWTHVNVTMPTPLFERFSKFAHDQTLATGKLVSRSDIINELVREKFERVLSRAA